MKYFNNYFKLKTRNKRTRYESFINNNSSRQIWFVTSIDQLYLQLDPIAEMYPMIVNPNSPTVDIIM